METKIRALITPSLEAMGYVVVRVRLRDGGSKGSLEVLAERKDSSGMSLDDCVEISHAVSALLEVEDPISGPYDLEVSSPGLDRPLVSLDDFARFVGNEAKVEMMLPLEGRKRFRGIIEGVQGEDVRVIVDGVVCTLPFSGMRSARLVLTDALIGKHPKKKAH